MNDLQLVVHQEPGVIQWNFEDLKAALAEEMKVYATIVYTDDNIKTAKADIANLRKLRKSVEDRRKEIKERCLEPYNVIEDQARQLTGLIDEPIILIDSKVKQYEAEQKAKRKEEIIKYMEKKFSKLDPQIAAKLKFKTYDTRWENATATKKSWKDAIDAAYNQTLADLRIIEDVDPDFKEAVMKAYQVNLILSDAMTKAQELQKQKEIVLENERRRQEQELLRAERERVMREEAERRRQEEEARKAQQAKEEAERVTAEVIPQETVTQEHVPDRKEAEAIDAFHAVMERNGLREPDPKRTIIFKGTEEQYRKVLAFIRYIKADYEEV